MVLLIVPCFFVGFTNKSIPGVPRELTYFHKLFFLFPKRLNFWPVSYIQAQFKKNGSWITLRDKDYFRLQPFGYRDRTARFWELFWLSKTVSKGRAELAAWVRQRYMQLYPSHPAPIAVRFVMAYYLPGRDGNPARWQKPPLESFLFKETAILSTHQFIELPSSKQNSKSPASIDCASGRFRVGKEKLNNNGIN